MELQHIIFQVFKALSLVSWYLESPQTASFGKVLANCNDFSLACLEAGQNSLRTHHQQKAHLESRDRLQRLAEIDAELAQEESRQDQAPHVEEAINSPDEGNTSRPIINITQHVTQHIMQNKIVVFFNNPIFLGPWHPDLASTDAFGLMQAQCAKLSDAQKSIEMDASETASRKTLPGSMRDPSTYPQSTSRYKAFLEDYEGISPGTVWDNMHRNFVFGAVLSVFFVGLIVILRKLLKLVSHIFQALRNLHRHYFAPVQTHPRSQADPTTPSDQEAQSPQATDTASPAPDTQAAPSHPAQQPQKPHQQTQSRHPPSAPPSIAPEQALRPRQPPYDEAADAIPAGFALVKTSELDDLRKQAYDTLRLQNASISIADAIERGAVKADGHQPIRANNVEPVRRIRFKLGLVGDEDVDEEGEEDV
ncbi:hypothetical protein PMIN06_002754 [Paraphaeosphaeria minitans]